MLWGINRTPYQAGTYRLIGMSPNYGTRNLDDLCQINPLKSANACALPCSSAYVKLQIIYAILQDTALVSGL